MLIGHSHVGSKDGASTLGEFWEGQSQESQASLRKARWECCTNKSYQAMWLNLDKNYVLI